MTRLNASRSCSPTFSPPLCQPRTDQGLRRAPGARVELEIAALLLAPASVALTLCRGSRQALTPANMATVIEDH